jgi:hypothetical protein
MIVSKKSNGSSPVLSVNSKTGDVILNKEDIGLGNCDNTSDTNKPVSSATQTALNEKSDTSHNHTLNNLSEKSYNSLTDKPSIPDELSDLAEDSTHRVVTDTEKNTWNGKADGNHNHNLNDLAEKSYNSLDDKPIDGAVSVSYAPDNPTPLAGTGIFMFGLGSTLTITPLKTGRVMFFINFIPTGAGMATYLSSYQLAYGAGVAPANGAVATGTNFDSADSGSNYIAPLNVPQYTHTHCFILSGLIVGTTYWFDVKGQKAVGTTNIGMSKIRCSIIELPY